MPKMVNLAIFWKPEDCGQTVIPDRSVFIEQKLMENAKIENIKWDILANFQTMWGPLSSWQEIRDQSHLFKNLNAI